MARLDGDGYEAWVSGVDPDTGELRGRVRNDEHALRFAEVVVNGPKSWSVAAELHPDVAAAYEGAQDRAAVEIVRYFAQHATTRVGPRGAQVATAVERVEAVSVRHYTSRAGDPHRHLHLQINARVQAVGKWRGIDSVAVRDSIGAVQGIGHATVMGDPAFRAALAGHGFTLDPDTGEVLELAGQVEAFSKRAEQITAQIDGYEADWRAANPGQEPGPALRRSWDARAWAEHRPGKTPPGGPEPAPVAHQRWLGELADLGYQPPTRAVSIVSIPVGRLDRDAAAGEVLSRLTATRSAWNQHDVRGVTELLLARAGVVAEAGVRREVADDITARAQARSVLLLEERAGTVPAHIRAWTSAEAVAVEADLAGRFAVRGAEPARDADAGQVDRAAAAAGMVLDPTQADAAAALAGGHALVLITGAAGAGKTTTLATTRAALAEQGQQLVVVTPTLKAARGAAAETGARTGSAAWLVHQHGWRWDDAGAWTRLHLGGDDPKTGAAYSGPSPGARLNPGDLLVVDEAGMLDQDTARALLTVADEQHARLALVGDPHQLAAIGRGGVLDLAARWAERSATLDVIHRFTRDAEIEPGVWATVADVDYAALSLRLRAGAGGDPAVVFDDLAAGGHVHIHTSGEELRNYVAAHAAGELRAGRAAAVSVATNEAAHRLNAAIRDQLIAAGYVDDGQTGNPVVTTSAGERVGVGDRVATRSNDRDADVANRDTWIVTVVHPDGALTVTPTTNTASTGGSQRILAAGYVNRHVELAYATTIHGVQGETAYTGLLVLDEHTGAAAAYVGMTRGRTANTVHFVADDLQAARAQWIDAAGRGRADLGVGAARAAAQRAANIYTTPAAQPPAAVDPERVARVLDQLHAAWTEQDRAQTQLERLEPRLARAHADHTRQQAADHTLAPLREAMTISHTAADKAQHAADQARTELDKRTDEVRRTLRSDWDRDLTGAATDARTVHAGTGRLGLGRGRVNDAQHRLDKWANHWQPVLNELPARLTDPAALVGGWHAEQVNHALEQRARQLVNDELPHQVHLVHSADTANQAAQQAKTAYLTAAAAEQRRASVLHAASGWRGLAEELPHLAQQTTHARGRLDAAERRIQHLTADPAITSQDNPESFLAAAHTHWVAEQATAELAAHQRAAAEPAHLTDPTRHHEPHYGRGSGRDGPSIGR